MTSVMRRVMQRLSRGRASVNRAPAASPDHATGWVAALALVGVIVAALLLVAGEVR